MIKPIKKRKRGLATRLRFFSLTVVLIFSSLFIFSCGLGAETEKISGLTITGRPANDTVELAENAGFILDIDYSPNENIASFSVVWSSNNVAVASINPSGKVSVHKKGSVKISAAVKGSPEINDSFTLTVTDASGDNEPAAPVPSGIVINGIPENKTVRLEDGDFSLSYGLIPEDSTGEAVWNSSDTSVALIDENGNITPLKAGTTVIKVSVKNNEDIKDSFTLIVDGNAGIDYIGISNKPLYNRLAKGENASLTVSVLPSDSSLSGLSWSSSVTLVAVISETGVITAVNAGRTEIKVQSVSGIYDSFELIVFDGAKNYADFENAAISGSAVTGTGFTISAGTRCSLSIISSTDEMPEGGKGRYLKVTNTNSAWTTGPSFKAADIRKSTDYRVIADIKLISGHPVTNFQLRFRTNAGANVYTENRSLHMVHGETRNFSYDFRSTALDFDYMDIFIFSSVEAVDSVLTIDNFVLSETNEFYTSGYESFEHTVSWKTITAAERSDYCFNWGDMIFKAESASGYFSIDTTKENGEIPFSAGGAALKANAVSSADAAIAVTSKNFNLGQKYNISFKIKVISGTPVFRIKTGSGETGSLKDLGNGNYIFSGSGTLGADGTVRIYCYTQSQKITADFSIDDLLIFPSD